MTAQLPLAETIADPAAAGTATAGDAAPSQAPADDDDQRWLRPGTRLQEYEITGVIGQGGFGIVYAAHDVALDRQVAIKEFLPAQLAFRGADGRIEPSSDKAARTFRLGLRSFLNEAQLLARFRHPALVEVLRFWEQDGTAYLVMPLYRGKTLLRFVREEPHRVDPSWIRSLLAPLLGALEHMHAADCLHRDISPENILILDNGAPMLLDLGAARRVIGGHAQALTVMLKPGYAPIEQYVDDPTLRQGPWTDLYALACVLYLGLTGKAPPAAASRVLHDTVVPLATLQPVGYPEPFLRAIDAAMSIRPEARPQSVAEFRRLANAPPAPRDVSPLERCLQAARTLLPEQLSARDRDPAQMPSAARRPRVHPLALAGLAVAVLAAILMRDADPPSPVTSAIMTAAAEPAAVGSDVAGFAAAAPPPEPMGATAEPAIARDAATALAAEPVAPSTEQPIPHAPPAAASTPGPRQQPTQPPPAERGAAAPARAAAAQVAVRVNVRPWGEVVVNGVARGVSPPLTEVALAPGRHLIEFRNPAAPPKRIELTLRNGQPVTLSHQFQERTP